MDPVRPAVRTVLFGPQKLNERTRARGKGGGPAPRKQKKKD